MTGRPLISLRDVRKSYGDYFELGPIELEVEAGCVVAVIGPNGSGKSTLFGMLMGLIHPSSGEVRLFGLSYPKDEVAIKQRIGYVPERAVGHDRMRVKDLAEFVSYWYPRWDQRIYQDLLRRSEIDPDKRFGKLSKGAQRRLSFALAVATGAELLLLDEPTAGVDPLARQEMLEDIARFMQAESRRSRNNKAVVFSTHFAEEVRRIADYVAVLVDGEFLGFHEKDTLLQRWKTLWVDREPEGDIAGAVEVVVGGSSLTRIVSDSPEKTQEALLAQSIRIARREAMDLEEILPHQILGSRSLAAQRAVWEESVEQGATPTYYPGDKVRLRLEIEHLPNFKEVEAVFLGYSDIEGGLPVRQSMYARGSNIRVLETNADGLKISEVLCEEDVERRTFLPGNVYELAEVIGVTVKDTRVYFDPSDLQGLRFRYADEPTTQIHATVRHAELLPRVD